MYSSLSLDSRCSSSSSSHLTNLKSPPPYFVHSTSRRVLYSIYCLHNFVVLVMRICTRAYRARAPLVTSPRREMRNRQISTTENIPDDDHEAHTDHPSDHEKNARATTVVMLSFLSSSAWSTLQCTFFGVRNKRSSDT